MSWAQKAASLVERHPEPFDRWEQAYLRIAAGHGKELGLFLSKFYTTCPDDEKDLIENCLAELRPVVATLYQAADSGESWLTDADPTVVASEGRKAIDALDKLFGCVDVFRDQRRDIGAYEQAVGWPELPAILFDRSRVPAGLQHFRKPEIRFANGEMTR